MVTPVSAQENNGNMVTLAQYQKMNPTQKRKLKRDEIEALLDEVLDTDVSGDTIKSVITETLNAKLDEKFNEFKTTFTQDHNNKMTNLGNDVEQLRTENNTLKKAVLEQQKFLEQIRREKNRNNVFVSGIPCKMDINGTETTDTKLIIDAAFKVALPNITDDQYTIIKDFDAREGNSRHSAKVKFNDNDVKENVVKGAKELKKLKPEDHPLRKIYIKWDQPPLTNKENNRLFTKMITLRNDDADENNEYKIKQGKLLKNNVAVDEFNLSNQLFL